MADKQIFVGRKAELKQFEEVLAAPEGQAVLVVGQAGMGKTMLVEKMAELAVSRPDLKCGAVRYEVISTDSPNSTMSHMLDHAFEAARVTEGSFDGTNRRREQWRALLNVVNIGDLV
ncbi:MAG: AAA family ATPase [bacterium]